MRLINKLIASFAIVLLVACGAEKEKVTGWVLNGTLNGFTDGEIGIVKTFNDQNIEYVPIVGGKFTMKGDKLAEPKGLNLQVKGSGAGVKVYVDNGTTTLVADYIKGERKNFRGEMEEYAEIEMKNIDGTIVNQHHIAHRKYSDEQYAKLDRSDMSKVADDAYIKQLNEIHNILTNYRLDFIKKNPNAYYSGELVCNDLSGKKDKAEIQTYIDMLGSELNHSGIKALQKRLTDIKDVDVSQVISASNVAYQVDGSYDGSAFKNAKYLAILSNNNLVTLNNDKSISIIDANGKKIKSFIASTTTVPSTMAVDEKDNIYVLVPVEDMVEVSFRGKKSQQKRIVSYNCDIFDVNGKKLRTLKIDGIDEATGARVANNKIMIADMGGRNIAIINSETGAQESEVKNMRPCCGILDFDINDKNELLVANLGAFRVQKYDTTGKQLLSFGSRGEDVSKFHGCCNPVSLAYLSNGAIVTVEKDPTRVKVFSKEGAIAVKGIDEMVKGCSYIPMTVDSKDNLYLASPTKGVVRCVSI